jgi:hypothetical protein
VILPFRRRDLPIARKKRDREINSAQAESRGVAARGRAATRKAPLVGEISEVTALRSKVAQAMQIAGIVQLPRHLELAGRPQPTQCEAPDEATAEPVSDDQLLMIAYGSHLSLDSRPQVARAIYYVARI